MVLGVAVGSAVAIAMLFHVGASLPWLFLVGLTKLTLMGSLGLIAGGGVLRRLAVRAEQRRITAASNSERGTVPGYAAGEDTTDGTTSTT
jgi:hypothetical protein